MFGYIIINQGEMKFKDYDVYHAFYCGLCRALKEKYGIPGQMTLSYDMTFLLILLSGLYEPKTRKGTTKCVAHPLGKHPFLRNEFSEYVADMNVLLTYYKCLDDWHDERKRSRLVYARLLKKAVKRVQETYPEKCRVISENLQKISRNEKTQEADLDTMAGYFGHIMEEIFAWRKDEWDTLLRGIGFYLGKFIYLADAYEDIEKDLKEGSYNPLVDMYRQDGFEQSCRQILTMMISECSRIFEMLPIIEYTEILRNILYSGVWYRFDLASRKREQKNETLQEKK